MYTERAMIYLDFGIAHGQKKLEDTTKASPTGATYELFREWYGFLCNIYLKPILTEFATFESLHE